MGGVILLVARVGEAVALIRVLVLDMLDTSYQTVKLIKLVQIKIHFLTSDSYDQ